MLTITSSLLAVAHALDLQHMHGLSNPAAQAVQHQLTKEEANKAIPSDMLFWKLSTAFLLLASDG